MHDALHLNVRSKQVGNRDVMVHASGWPCSCSSRPLSKNAHGALRIFRREIKKAREFEARKLVRRLKVLSQGGSGHEDASKLEAQLRVTRAADINHLAALRVLQTPESLEDKDMAVLQAMAKGTEDRDAMQTLVNARILASKCVRGAALELSQRAEHAAAAAAARKAKADRRAAKVVAPSEDGRMNEARTSDEEGVESEGIDEEGHAAVEKLLNASKKVGHDGDRDLDGASSEDSGVIGVDGLGGGEEEDSLRGSGVRKTSKHDVGHSVKPEHGSAASNAHRADRRNGKDSLPARKLKEPAKVQKKKNRLGQRERKRLAGILPSRDKARPVAAAGRGDAAGTSSRAGGWKSSAGNRGTGKASAAPRVQVPAATEDVHPSWAAKLREQQLMKQQMHGGVSKKIVFD